MDDGVAVRGEIDLATAGDLAEALYDAAATTDTGFLIDLSQVTFIDSTGLDALTRVLNVHAGKRFVIVPSNQVFTLLHLSGLTRRVAERGRALTGGRPTVRKVRTALDPFI